MIINKISQIKELINDAQLDEWVELELYGHIFKRVKFEEEPEEGFIWCAERSWKNIHMTGWVFPLKTEHYVKYFKTMNGCKRNFTNNHLTPWCFKGE